MRRRVVAGLAGISMLTAVGLAAVPGTATAEVEEGLGYQTAPQPYLHKPQDYDWVGSYLWNGEHVWCVQYAFRAPDSNEEYVDGDDLLTKWGDPLDPQIASNISYLLLRYSGTESNDESAALAHLMHSWTAAPREGHDDLNPNNEYTTIGYDIDFHYNELPESTRLVIDHMQADAEINRGPWTVEMAAPEGDQIIGTPDSWQVDVLNTAGVGVGGIPVELQLTDAELAEPEIVEPPRTVLLQKEDLEGDEDGTTTQYLNTPEDGSPLVFDVVPTGPNPSVVANVQTPAAQPQVRVPPDAGNNVQRVVTTGGEDTVTVEAALEARTAPGIVEVSKVDAATGLAVADVSLRITGADEVTPAIRQDGEPLVGDDGEPLVVITDAEGKAVIEDLQTPQEICLIETAAPPGYEEEFDPNDPPTACGTVEPGQTLSLSIANQPNPTPTVPSTIPAGDVGAGVTTASASTTQTNPAALAGLGALVVIGATLTGLVWHRRLAGRDSRRQ
ncbi:MSCRAMM family protein [Actinoalloteichus hymeniacidonis]|uniref:SpaA-like prealbumin fold domain-containing protein n=1 Tax=Actinoalloteichus hymeniacidonis TaxID=340345 RepID=A0AAC9HLV8_9PSEU|nr:hypothetical protein [Actinoalloteichus hymeniacidonis]AOS61600.1 hypothetical protein TL08_03850 [Actinoalloteichus hymeniacidonis]MBB5910390.1 hypothetical protein [Actinoalloteichus hymeniacidonis]